MLNRVCFHQAVDHFVCRAVPADGDDHIVAIFGGLPGQLDGVSGVHCAGPIHLAVAFHQVVQVRGELPGVAHVGVGVQDHLDALVCHGTLLTCGIYPAIIAGAID
jgi:hypothetical protein